MDDTELKRSKEAAISSETNKAHMVFMTEKVDLTASGRATEIKVFCSSEFDQSIVVEITNGAEIEWTAGTPLTNLTFKIYNEAGLELEKQYLSASNMKVSWVSLAEMRKVSLNEGKLPNLPTPRLVGRTCFNGIALFRPPLIQRLTETGPKLNVDVSLDFRLNVKPRPGPAYGLTLNIGGNGTNKVRANSKMDNEILVNVIDKFRNGVSGITLKSCEELEVFCAVNEFEGNSIDENCLQKSLGQAEGAIVVRGLKFKRELASILGTKTVYISYKHFKEPLVVELVADVPEKIRWEFNKEWNNKCLTLCKSSELRIGIQLCDIFNNKVAYQGAVVKLGTDKNLVLRPEIRKSTTGAEGKANFGIIEFGLKDEMKPIECPFKICPFRCFGKFFLRTKTEIKGREIISPPINFHVICDPSKPEKFQIGCCNEMTPEKHIIGDDIVVGKKMPFFTVSMLSANDILVSVSVYRQDVYLQIVKLGDLSKTFLDIFATEFDSRRFKFTIEDAILTLAGIYHLQFYYKADSMMFSSDVITLKVKCDVPVVFKPKVNPLTKTYVSNTSLIFNRTITSGLRMALEDKYGNFVGQDFDEESLNSLPTFNGEVAVEIKGCRDQSLEQLPKFSGNKASLSFLIKKGETFIDILTLEEKTCGIDSSEYALKFTPNLQGLNLEPYEVKFIFLNDAQRQAELSRLEEESANAGRKVKDIKEQLDCMAIKVDMYKSRVEMASTSEMICLSKIRKLTGCKEDVIFDRPEDISRGIKVKQLKMIELEIADNSRPFRECTLGPCPDEPGILGKIGHLALLDNPSEASILSWHMQGDMDVIVTYSSEKAKELNRRYAGRQPLIALEGTFRGNLPAHWNGPLPHERVKTSLSPFRAKGNQIYARNLLHFTKDPEHCRILFGSLLGDTLIVDTIEEAIDYRNQLLKTGSNCPTILTRNGKRLANNGKFGGLMNKAPECPSRLRFGFFGLTPNPDIAELSTGIGLLKLLFNTFSDRLIAEDNLTNYKTSAKKELDKLENDLKAAQQQLKVCHTKHAEQSTYTARGTLKRNASVCEENEVCEKKMTQK